MIKRLIIYSFLIIFAYTAFLKLTCQTLVLGYSLKEDVFLRFDQDVDCNKFYDVDFR